MTAEQSIRNIEREADAINAGMRNVDNTFALLADALKPTPDPRADLVDLFEARAETHYDKSWIEVEEAVDLVMDRDAETPPGARVEWAWRNDCGEIRTATSVHAARLLAAKYNGTAMSRTIGLWVEADS